MEYKNTGFIYTPVPPKTWVFGGTSGVLDKKVLQDDGQWLDFLPAFESQHNKYIDAMNCVSMSANNAVETIARRLGVTMNRSDRFTAKMSGTTHSGNTFYKVWDSIALNDGSVPEERWPFPESIKTWEDFYSTIPQEIIDEGRASLDDQKVRYEFVPYTASSLMDALRYAPVQVAIFAYPAQNSDGVYIRSLCTGNHAVLLVGYVRNQYWLIFDSYIDGANEHGKVKKLAWNSIFWGAVLPTIVSLTESNPTMNLKEKVIYQLVEGPGGFFSRIGDSVFKLSSAEDFEAIRLRFKSIKVKDTSGIIQTIQAPEYDTVTLADMSGIQYRNMKGEVIGEFAATENE